MRSTITFLAALSTTVALVGVSASPFYEVPEPVVDAKVEAAVYRDLAKLRQSGLFVPLNVTAATNATATKHRRDIDASGRYSLERRGGGSPPPADCPAACVDGSNCRVGCKTAIWTTATNPDGTPAITEEYRPDRVVFVANGIPCAQESGCSVSLESSESATVTWSFSATVGADVFGLGASITASYGEEQTTTHAITTTIAIPEISFNYVGFIPYMTVVYGWVNYWEITNVNGDGIVDFVNIYGYTLVPNAAPDGSGIGDFVVCLGGPLDGPCKCVGGCSGPITSIVTTTRATKTRTVKTAKHTTTPKHTKTKGHSTTPAPTHTHKKN
ncbi:hypothetical protein HK101_000480 [Irineochytrium annulatum]|nr:hypothetical protein HK101_000480 [Irineochytrium annulatum]